MCGGRHDTGYMRITCPSCSAAYDVPDSLVTPGRVVRCARCGNEWSPTQAPPQAPLVEEPVSPAPEPPPPPVAEPVVEVRQSAMDRLSAHPATEPSTTGLRIAWALSLVVLIALAVAAYVWRAQIVAAWPPSARAYALFGMQPASQESRQ
jgi:predicted Zn finger-like uncharacterized protein